MIFGHSVDSMIFGFGLFLVCGGWLVPGSIYVAIAQRWKSRRQA